MAQPFTSYAGVPIPDGVDPATSPVCGSHVVLDADGVPASTVAGTSSADADRRLWPRCLTYTDSFHANWEQMRARLDEDARMGKQVRRALEFVPAAGSGRKWHYVPGRGTRAQNKERAACGARAMFESDEVLIPAVGTYDVDVDVRVCRQCLNSATWN